MKTKFFVLAVSILTALGLSSCYTEFATTGEDNGYGYPTYSPNSSSDYNDSTYAGGSYDTTEAPEISNTYDYYGCNYPWYDYNNVYTPSPWWWQNDSWFDFGWGLNSWYGGGFGWGSPYYAYNPYGFGSYYSPYYNGYYPYGHGFYHERGNVGGRPRPSSVGDTREGRQNYGGGSMTRPFAPSAGSVTGTGNAASAGTGASASREPASAQRARSSGTSVTPASSSAQPQSQPTSDQPRVRDNGASGVS